MKRFSCLWGLPALLLGLLAGCGLPAVPEGPRTPGIVADDATGDPPSDTARAGDYLFCFWNVENLFDDQDDGRTTRGDEPYDTYFAKDAEAREAKLERLCRVLLNMNAGRGPDILALAEVESRRAVELLRDALNRRLENRALAYQHILHKDPGGSRHIGTAILTRLPVEADRTDVLGKRQRILEGRITVHGHPLVLMASHWSSRISDKTGDARKRYGDVIYGRFKALFLSNPRVDVLVCGDFNDNPDDPSVLEHLHAVGDEEAVRASAGRNPLLFNLFAGPWKDGAFTHYYRRNYLFDQVCVSPGMLDESGWSCDPASARVVKKIANRNGRPNRFGGASDKRAMGSRGASDHFPVTVLLSVR